MSKFRRYRRELLMTAAVLAPAAAGFVWLYWMGKMPKWEPASETRAPPSVISARLIDLRDGRNYRIVVIGGQVWTAQNMNYQTDNSWCYYNSDSCCEKYGRLYEWEAANIACPDGWHLPSRAEWDALAMTVGGQKIFEHDWSDAGKKLKSTSGWNRDSNGTDKYGFSALSGGYRLADGSFGNNGYSGYWWTATENSDGYAYYRYMNYNDNTVHELHYPGGGKSNGFSVRCVQNTPHPVEGSYHENQ